MNRKTQRGKHLLKKQGGGNAMQSALAWLLVVAMVLDGICVLEKTGMSVQAAEPTVEAEEISAEDLAEKYDSSEENYSLEENYSSWDAADVSAGDSVSGNEVMALSLDGAEDDIASGTYENIAWRIDANGTLTVEGTGEFSASMGKERAPWYSEREAVKSAEIRISGLCNASYMFSGCSELTSVDASGFDTSSVTDMSGMFYDCKQLLSLNMRGWDTSRVTDMSYMFYGSGLPGLYPGAILDEDISGWDTSSVTDMSHMFDGCYRLTSLDLNVLDTSNVVDMSHMFEGCDWLVDLDLSGLDTSRVTSMQRMFSGCSGLKNLRTIWDKQRWDTSSVTDMSGMFSGCSNIQEVRANWNTSSVTDMHDMFSGCALLWFQHPDFKISSWDTSSVTDMSHMFSGCCRLYSQDISGWDTSSVTDMSGMFSGDSINVLNLSSWNTSNVTNMSGMFSSCGSIALPKSWDTSSVTDMSYMFADCSVATSLDLGSLDTSSVTDMSHMFEGCSRLTSLDLSGFNTGSVTDMSYMFSGYGSDYDNGYDDIDVKLDLSGFNTSNVVNMSHMFDGCKWLDSLDMSGFNTSCVTNMSHMFDGCYSLPSLDLRGWDTSRVVDMSSMFSDCSTSNKYMNIGVKLNLSGWNTSNVTNMSNMFSGCYHTYRLDLDGWDTGSVENMSGMFSDCSDINLPKSWDTSSVTDMSHMFDGCRWASSLDLSGWNTSRVTDMSYMFYHGSGWPLDLSGFDTSNVTDTSHMFDGSYVGRLNLSGWGTNSVTDMNHMFYHCSALVSLDLSEFDTSSVTDMSYMFAESRLESLNLRGFDTSSVTNMASMFSNCSSLRSLDMSGWDTGGVTNMSGMFASCKGLTSLDLSGFDTSSVTSMEAMFSNCSSLRSLDMSGWDTGGVTNMSGMFYCCGNLTSIDVSGFDTSSVTNMASMFSNCSGLTSLDLSGFDTSSVTSMQRMFSGCSGLTSIRTSWDKQRWDTSSVTDMNYMFQSCSSLMNVDVSGFDTSSVERMSGMFYCCGNLTSIDVSGWDTGSVTHMDSMFSGCSGLGSLDVSDFDTSSVILMYHMFDGCSGLASLDLSSWDTGSVTEMSNMFSGCSSLTTLYTPYNTLDNSVNLPTAESDVWYDSAGTTYTNLPVGLDHSIVLMKNKKPDAAMPRRLTVRLTKSVYEPGSVVKPEDLTVKYRGTDGKTITLSYKGENAEASGYTMSAVDMSTLGVKTLTISYNDGVDTLTESVSFTVSVLLTDVMVTLPEGEYVYNGIAHKPVPIVKSVDGSDLTLGEDYTVSYTNNVDAGEAILVVRGRNAYGGAVTKSFTIQKATLENVEISFLEPCGEAHENRTRDLSDWFGKLVYNSGNGYYTGYYTIGEITEHNIVANGKGSVLSGTPVIDKLGILSYSTNAGTAGDTVLIPVTVTFDKNYNDALILVTVRLTDKKEVSISGITVKKKSVYNGSPMVPNGTAVVRTMDGTYTDVTEQVTLVYHYTGAQADGTAYDSDTAPIHVGSYILSVTVAENDSYEGNAEYPFVIGKAPLTVTVADMELVIGEFDALPDESVLVYDITGFCGTHTAQDVLSIQPVVSYGLNGKKIDKSSIALDKAGSYELIPSGAVLNQTTGLDYEIRSYKKGTLTIANDASFHVNTVPDQTYTGSAIKPAVTVYYGSRRLTEKTDYTITYKNNIKVNDATVENTAPTITITGKGDYSGKQTITFVIKPKSIAEEDVTVAELIAAQSSKVQKPVPVLTYQGKKLKNKTDFTVSYPDENKAGAYQAAATYTVTVTGIGNYTGTKNLNFTITNKTLLTKAKVTVKAKDYTGSAVTLNTEDITVKVGKTTLAYGTDYILSYRNNTQAGKATVIVTGAGENYAGSKEATFQIKGESIAKAQISGIVNKTYTGAAQTQDIQVQLNGKTLKIGDDYTVSYAKEVNAGTATVTVTGKGGYTGSVKKSFKIMAFDLQTNEAGKLQGAPQNLTVAYTKGGATPALTLIFDGKPLVAKKDYMVTYKNNKKPASASDAKAPSMVIKGKGNFKGTLTIPFAITVSNLETDGNVSIMAADTAYVDKAGKYMAKPVLTDANGKKLAAGTDYEKNFTYTLVGADGIEKALTAADTVPVGSEVKVTVTGKGNYTGTLSTTYRITKASFSKAKITVTPQAYKGTPVTLSGNGVTVKIGSDTLTYGKDYTIVEGSYQNNTKRGTATVIIKGLGDYGGTKTVKFKITAKLFANFLKF